MKLDFTLSFSDTQWICFNKATTLKGDSLDDIDNALENYLKSNYSKRTIEVSMFFDFDRFPQWHRQYMSHYFNRRLIFNLDQ